MRKLTLIGLALVLSIGPWAFGAEGSATDADAKAAAKKVQLFNGKDLDGWKLFIPDENVDPTTVWQVRDGVVHCTGSPSGYFRTTKKYENYRLSFEWRWADQAGNSGLLLHIQGEDKVWPMCIESQLKSGDAGDFYVIDTDFKEHADKDSRRVPQRHESNEKPLGEWNKKRVVCKGNTIRVWVNGLLQNEASETTVAKGYIGFQSEGAPIEFRNIVLKPIPAEAKEKPKPKAEGSKKEGS